MRGASFTSFVKGAGFRWTRSTTWLGKSCMFVKRKNAKGWAARTYVI